MTEGGSLTREYREWILTHHDLSYTVQELHDKADRILFVTDYAVAAVSFRKLKYEIVELSITEKKSEDIKFYLHFELNDLYHAQELFEEMLSSLYDLRTQIKIKVLLCCTSGLTTSYFAMRLNEVAGVLDLEYEFEAVSYDRLFERAYTSNIILLAPQVSYLYEKAAGILKGKRIIRIPPVIFAKYDAAGMIEIIRSEPEKDIPAGEKQQLTVANHRKLLIISVISEFKRSRIIYRIYDDEKIIEEAVILKDYYRVRDLEDIVDVSLTGVPDLDMICVCTPGVIYDGHLTFKMYRIYDVDVAGLFSEKYHIPCIFENDANAMVQGYYLSQDKYKDISFYFHPHASRKGGVGNMIGGKLHKGRNNIAGEMQYLADAFAYSKKPEDLVWTPEGAVELLSKYLTAIISCIDPEAIIIHCDMITDTEDLRNELKNTFQEQFIPDLIKVEDVTEYMFAGMIRLANDQI
ncbi:MAG: ROK family protein [Solobacterium sp.]|nr:ROK family protein [Solobacterium sp.]